MNERVFLRAGSIENARQSSAPSHRPITKSVGRPASPVRSVNFHLFKPCDANCTFCFATFRDIDGFLPRHEARELIRCLTNAGCQKINFAGGEPTLHPFLHELIPLAKELGLTTSIVTNGARLPRLLERCSDSLDWVGLSVDSADEGVQAGLGRGRGDHVRRAAKHASLCHDHGVRLKLNTVVTRLNVAEDMREYVNGLRPERWKVFQVLPVEGQNDGAVEPLLIPDAAFAQYIKRNREGLDDGIELIDEANDAMTDSYAMIDPLGCFYGNTEGRHVRSEPILDVGVSHALSQVGFASEKLEARGGLYQW